jgi:hypothetical protein
MSVKGPTTSPDSAADTELASAVSAVVWATLGVTGESVLDIRGYLGKFVKYDCNGDAGDRSMLSS